MLHTLRPSPHARRRPRRRGRGISAGGGKTAGRGTKGQHARTGKGRRFGFEGGQTPLLRRQPKIGGFRNPRRIPAAIVDIRACEEKLDPGTYDVAALRERGIVKGKGLVKLLGKGVLTKAFSFTIHAASKGARIAVEQAGGKVIILCPKKPRS